MCVLFKLRMAAGYRLSLCGDGRFGVGGGRNIAKKIALTRPLSLANRVQKLLDGYLMMQHTLAIYTYLLTVNNTVSVKQNTKV